MSIQTAVEFLDPVLLAVPIADRGEERTLDARWDAWIAHGRLYEIARKRRLRLAILCALVIAAAVALAFGVTAGEW